ncbi:hypothetical protein CCP3SC15_2120002 [Gammaproteobacteria bacterium]
MSTIRIPPSRPAMIENRTVLAAVDLDATAETVVRRALQLATVCGSPLVVTHVVDYHSGFESDHIPFQPPAQIAATMRQTAQEWLSGLVARMGAQADVVIRWGHPREDVAALAEELDAGVVVVGTSSRFWGTLTGLADDQRLRNANRSVLAVAHTAGGLFQRLLAVLFDLIAVTPRRAA